MTISNTIDFTVTSAWQEVTNASTSLSGLSFRFGFPDRSKSLFWRVATTAPGASANGEYADATTSLVADTLGASSKLYVRAGNNAPFPIIVHVSA